MINNEVNLTGVVVGVYQEKFDNNLKLFELEIDKANYEPVVLPILYGEFTSGEFKKGDTIIVEGCLDIINTKLCCVALKITNLVVWKKKIIEQEVL